MFACSCSFVSPDGLTCFDCSDPFLNHTTLVVLLLILLKTANQTLVLFLGKSKQVCCNPQNRSAIGRNNPKIQLQSKCREQRLGRFDRPAVGYLNSEIAHLNGESMFNIAQLTQRFQHSPTPAVDWSGMPSVREGCRPLAAGGKPPPAVWGAEGVVPSLLARLPPHRFSSV